MLIRFIWGFFLTLAISVHAMPTELTKALADFRADGPRGWAFTQSTSSASHSLVERYDPLIRAPFSWNLLTKDGRQPTEKEMNDYREKVSYRSNDGTASVKDQIIPETCKLVSETDENSVYEFKLKPGSEDDHTAEFMTALFTLHRPSGAITQVELGNTEPFSPMIAVQITEARTTMDYSIPTEECPSLLLGVHTKVRGRAFWLRSLDDDLYVKYSDHVDVKKVVAAKKATETP